MAVNVLQLYLNSVLHNALACTELVVSIDVKNKYRNQRVPRVFVCVCVWGGEGFKCFDRINRINCINKNKLDLYDQIVFHCKKNAF